MHRKMRKKFGLGKGREKMNCIKVLTEDQEAEINHTNKGRHALKVDAERSAILSQNRMAVMLYKELQWDSRHAVANPSGMYVNAQRGLPCGTGCLEWGRCL